jgi:hypothetical protein
LATNKYAVEIKRNVGSEYDTGEESRIGLEPREVSGIDRKVPSVILMVNSALSRRVLCVAVAILADVSADIWCCSLTFVVVPQL